MRRRLSWEEESYLYREGEKLEDFLTAVGVPKLKVEISLVYLQDDLESLLMELGIKVLSVDRDSFLAYWKGGTRE